MATKKKATTKKATAKKATAKKAAPAKKAAAKKKAAPAKKSVAPKKAAKKKAPAAKKNAAAKKTAVKKAAPKKKAAPAKKAAPKKKAAVKKAVPKKKAAPAKKAAAKKAAPKKKVAVKKEAPKKKAAPAKKAAEKKAAAPKKAAPKRAPKKKAPKKSKATITKVTAPKKETAPQPKPRPSRRNAREEAKKDVIVAHRKLENKSKTKDKAGKTMINYQPKFTRSILDEPVEKQGPVYRYSDNELKEFRELINRRLEAARKELNYLQGLITRKDEAGTEDTENRYMNMEDGSGAMEREQLAQLASRQIQFINHLEKAMIRIENKTYGICRVTGKLIEKARLRAVPHATLSIEAKKMMSNK